MPAQTCALSLIVINIIIRMHQIALCPVLMYSTKPGITGHSMEVCIDGLLAECKSLCTNGFTGTPEQGTACYLYIGSLEVVYIYKEHNHYMCHHNLHLFTIMMLFRHCMIQSTS